MMTVDVALTVELSRVLDTIQVYVPAKFLVTFSLVYTPRLVGTDILLGLRISNIVMSGIFLPTQVTFSVSSSLTVTSGNSGVLRTETETS